MKNANRIDHTRLWVGFPEIYLLAIEQSLLYSNEDYIYSFEAENRSLKVDEINAFDETLIFLELQNYRQVLSFMNEFQSQNENAKFHVVTSIPSLRFLGIERDVFQNRHSLFSVNEFIAIISKKYNPRLEEVTFPNQISPTMSFFNDYKLTAKQIQVLRLMVSGFTNSEIAKRLVVSEKSVESSLKRMAIKMIGEEVDTSIYNPRILQLRKFAQILGII